MKFLNIHNNITIHYNQQNYGTQKSPTILFIHGLFSDMQGYKAQKIEEYAKLKKFNFVAFDNAGHGNSSGDFSKMNMTIWLECTIDLINQLALDNIVIVGSSKGGWISLLLAILNDKRIKSQILLAPAPDFTESIYDSLSNIDRENLNNDIPYFLNNNDEFEGIPIHKQLIEDGKKHLLLKHESIEVNIPTIIIQGMKDEAVSYSRSILLCEKIIAPYLTLKLLKNSEHRLSTDEDIKCITNSIDEILQVSH